MKVLFVINPSSGSQNQNNLEQLIEDKSRESGYEYLIHSMQGDNEEYAIKDKIASFNPEIVACAGGDGTVNLMAKLLANKKISLLILPTGSANGMAKELQLDSKLENTLSLITTGVTREIDLLKVNGKICIHLADVGLNARIVKRFESDGKRGLLTYAKHLFAELFLIKQYYFEIKSDGKQRVYKAVSLTFANATKYGTGAIINPNGKIDDGKFELIVIKPFPKIQLALIALKMFFGKIQNSEYVEVICSERAIVRCKHETTLQIDGEVIGKVKKIEIQMLHRALTVLVDAT